MTQIFELPLLNSIDDVRCFNCASASMSNHRASGYAEGRGQLVATCDECKMHTYYDLVERPFSRTAYAGRKL